MCSFNHVEQSVATEAWASRRQEISWWLGEAADLVMASAASGGYRPEDITAVVLTGGGEPSQYPKLLFGGWARGEAFVAANAHGLRAYAAGQVS